jgi:hypothetical protein
LWLLTAILSMLGMLIFFWWFVQTAWLGSFPGRSVAVYAFWAYTQPGISVAFLILAVYAFIKIGRTNEPLS